VKARDAKQARLTGAYCTLRACIRKNDPDIPERLKVTAIFCPPDNRRRDIDGMLSNIKSYLDGISSAIGVDDSRFEIAMRREAPVKGGLVRIELEAA
jgi:Holliday junction resolvase RusA-like endonuclease